jgi:hypothetical protein
MSIQAVRKHLVTITYLDYGDPMGVRYCTAGSVDDSGPALDGNHFETKAAAEAYIREWLSDEPANEARAKHGWTVERGEDVTRRVDYNPHGLM